MPGQLCTLLSVAWAVHFWLPACPPSQYSQFKTPLSARLSLQQKNEQAVKDNSSCRGSVTVKGPFYSPCVIASEWATVQFDATDAKENPPIPPNLHKKGGGGMDNDATCGQIGLILME